MKVQDWIVLYIISHALAAGTVWVFMHPSEGSFSAWCGLCATMGGIYHWLVARDQKEPDKK